jgi:hypothetical protein
MKKKDKRFDTQMFLFNKVGTLMFQSDLFQIN